MLGRNAFGAIVDEVNFGEWTTKSPRTPRRGEHPPFWRALHRLFAERPELLGAYLAALDEARDEAVASTLDAIIDAVLTNGCKHRRGTRRQVAETVIQLINSDPAVLLSVLATP